MMSINIIKKRIKVFESEMESLYKKIDELKKSYKGIKRRGRDRFKRYVQYKRGDSFQSF
jgi:prefoldin subunit 5